MKISVHAKQIIHVLHEDIFMERLHISSQMPHTSGITFRFESIIEIYFISLRIFKRCFKLLIDF